MKKKKLPTQKKIEQASLKSFSPTSFRRGVKYIIEYLKKQEKGNETKTKKTI